MSKTILRFGFLFLMMALSIQTNAQQDLSKYQEALTTYRNGACAFFTGVPSATPTTCNGFSDGEACITITEGGVGPFQYIWVDYPDITNCISGLDAGTYTVIVIDLGTGQSCSWDIIVNEPAALAVFTMNAVPPGCDGDCNGEANPIVIGGNGGNMFAYNSGENTQHATMLCDPFELTITDSEGCFTDTMYAFENAPLPIDIEGAVTDEVCAGQNDGAIDITVLGGNGGNSFSWTGPDFASSDEDISGLEPGEYTVTVTDQNLCDEQETFIIEAAEELLIDAILTDVICFGDSTGSIEITLTGGAGGFDFAWTGPDLFTSADEDIFNLKAGTYDLTITDASLCQKDTSFVINQNPAIDIQALITNPACFGETTGAIDVTVTGTLAIVDYSWTGDITSSMEDLSMLDEGTYNLEVTDAGNCMADSTFEIIAPPAIDWSFVVTDVQCDSGTDGSIDLTASGGTGDLTYLWIGPNTNTNDEDLIMLEEGDYDLTITDENFCTRDTTITILEPDPILIASDVTNIDCANAMNGSIEIDITGGTGAYTTEWTGPAPFNSSTDEDIFNLPAGPYMLTVTDENDCEVELSFSIQEPDDILIDFDVTDLLCSGDVTGAIDLTITGGQDPYTFMWTGLGTIPGDEDQTGLGAGDYTVIVTDFNDCTAEALITVNEPDPISIDTTVTHLSCFGDSDGSILLDITGGTGAYDISWVGPTPFTSSDEDLFGLSAGMYTVTVTDENLCTSELSVTIIEPDPIVVTSDLTNIVCASEMNGSIEIDITGGTGGYSTDWVGPPPFNTSTDEDIFNLPAGDYTLTVTDDSNCEVELDFEIIEPDEILIDFVVTDLLCNGDGTGEIDLIVSGGQDPYTYMWTGTGTIPTDEDQTGLEAGDYTVIVTDFNDCTAEALITVNEPDPIAIDTTVTHLSCFGDSDGSILLDITGGTGAYATSWVGPPPFTSNDEDLFGLSAGIYTVTVTDENDCTEMVSVEILEPQELLVDGNITHIDCFGAATGAIDITASNGTGDYSYDWIGPTPFTSNDEDLIGLEAGIYVVTVTDENDCSQDASFEVLENDTIIIDGIVTNVTCNGDNDGAISITVTGGIGPYDFDWTSMGFASIEQNLTDLLAGTYIVVVTDALGCTAEATFVVDEPAAIEITALLVNPSCFGDSNGDIDISVAGGSFPYHFAWTSTGGFNQSGIGIDISNLDADTYFLTITDDEGCTLDTSFVLTEPADLAASLDITNPGCDMANGSVIATVTGGTIAGDYTYTWFDDIPSPIGSNSDISGLGAGVYTFTANDDNGCMVAIPFELSDNVGSMTATITDVSCFGFMDGAIDVEVTGLTGLLDVNWTGDGFSSTDMDISALAAGDYTISVEDELGCNLLETYTVNEPDEIIITANIIHETCPDANDGAIDIEPSGGSGVFSYAWTGPGPFNSDMEDLTNLEPGIYEVVVTDDNMCTNTASFEVLPATEYTTSASITHIQCAGSADGAIDLSVSPALIGATYAWTGPNSFNSVSEDIIDLDPGIYDLTITTVDFCIINDSFEVLETDSILVDLNLTNSACGLNIGAVSATVTGGTVALDYGYSLYSLPDLTEVGTTAIVNGLSGGQYGYTITDDNGCTAMGTFTISDENGTIDALVTGVSCVGSMDGAIDITVTGLVGTLDYDWVGPTPFTSTDEDISGLSPGMYTVTVTDDNGCVIGDTYEVLDGTGITITGVVTHIQCNGDGNGAIDISYIGGSGDLDFDWQGPTPFMAITEDIQDLEAGDYTIVITDENGCQGTETFTIDEPELLTATGVTTPTTCNGDENGAIDLTVIGGTGQVGIQWIGPTPYTSTFEDISGLAAGTYSLTLTDANACVFMDDFIVSEPDPIVITLVDLMNSNCNDSTGSIEVFATGGNATYGYVWTNSNDVIVSTIEIANNLPEDTYTIEVTDSDGCSNSEDYVITNSEAEITGIIEHVSCHGFSDGAIDISIVGDITDPADTLWAGPNGFSNTIGDINGLIAGTYTVTITDAATCEFVQEFEVLEPDTLAIQSTIGGVTCNGDSNGAISVIVSGGTPSPDYIYQWADQDGPLPDNGPDLSNLTAGIYTLNVSDDVPCMAEFVLEIVEPEAISIQETLSDPTCSGLNDGTISIDISGGNGGNEYNWQGPNFNSTLEDIFNLDFGVYDLIITDDSNCVATASYTLNEIQVMDITLDITGLACNGDANASIDLSLNGDNGNPVFDWDGPNMFDSALEDIGMLEAGEYTINIEDALGCEIDSTFTITEPDALTTELISITDIICNGDGNGSISVIGNGGTPNISYAWMGPGGFSEITPDINNLEAGVYELTLTDFNLCTWDSTYTIAEPAPISIVLDQLSNTECQNGSDGAIEITVSGGSSGFDFDWIGPNGFSNSGEDISGLEVGDYIVNITDDNNCPISELFTIDYNVAIALEAGAYDPVCNGDSLTLVGTASPANSTFGWSVPGGATFSTDLTASVPISSTNNIFVLSVTNGNCTATDTAMVEVLSLPEPDAGEDQEVYLEDEVVLGGDPTWENAISYSWSPSILIAPPTSPSDANPIYIALSEQLFTVVVVGSNGCIGSDDVLITINPTVEVPDGFTPNGDLVNDTWTIENTELFPEMTARVFNRWGDELWSSGVGYPEPWDGTYKGKQLPVGTYYYVIELNDERFPNPITGPLTIFR